ncbi:hypothetical protein MMC11_002853 [Xylographa trunciseda]|nr:hypothetical protein [Xylographa trunciseda]
MLLSYCYVVCLYLLFLGTGTNGLPTSQVPLSAPPALSSNRTVSKEFFYELEELARIVDISYCVGTTGIQKPFLCASRCQEFPGFELVKTWNTGPLLADSCGYIAISHFPSPKRIIVAFRGTYSIANTIIDLSTIPQEYAPYPGDDGPDTPSDSIIDLLWRPLKHVRRVAEAAEDKCDDCTVHLGFMTSWRQTRTEILPHLVEAIKKYPDYQLTLVGHSLGGAVAALASLEFKARGWNPKVTTFGEPRIGNQPLMKYMDDRFLHEGEDESSSMYRRVTHVDDPVPLLPLEEWGFKMHAGEVFISKPKLSPAINDVQHCEGDEDPQCIMAGDSTATGPADDETELWLEYSKLTEIWNDGTGILAIPARYKLWQLFFAHRDYFWRLGLCIPGGDPVDWYREYPHNETDEL